MRGRLNNIRGLARRFIKTKRRLFAYNKIRLLRIFGGVRDEQVKYGVHRRAMLGGDSDGSGSATGGKEREN